MRNWTSIRIVQSVAATVLLVCGLSMNLRAFELGLYGGVHGDSEETESGGAILGVISFPVDARFAVDMRAGSFASDSKIKTLSKSVVRTTSVELFPRIHVGSGMVTGYIGAGPALFIMNEDLDPAVKALAYQAGFSYSESLDNAFGGVFGGGIDVAINKSVFLSADLTYLYYKPEVTATGSTGFSTISIHDTINMSALRALFGVKVRFGDGSQPTEQVASAASLSGEAPKTETVSVPTTMSPDQKIREFIVMGYGQILSDLGKGEGPYLTSLLDMLKLTAAEKPTAAKKIKALSEVYTNASVFADHVVDLFKDHLDASSPVNPSPSGLPIPPKRIQKPEETPAVL